VKEFTGTSNLGALPRTAAVNTVGRVPNGYENEGDTCTTHDGRQGKLVRAKTGGLICQVEGSGDMPIETVSEAGVALRFSSSSRTQIGKAHMEYDVHMRDVQGTGNLTITPIQGNPGNWFFDVSSPSANQFLDPAKTRTYAGVNVARVAVGGTRMAASAPQPKSVKERVEEQVKAVLAKKV
jgi:hypothetical protein